MSWRDMIRQSIGVYDPDESVLRVIVYSPSKTQMFSYSMHGPGLMSQTSCYGNSLLDVHSC